MEIKKKQGEIIDQYFMESFLNNRVFSIELDIARVCNANCIFCFQGDKTEVNRIHMNMNDYERLLIEAKQLGAYYIGFSGGEPFCNPKALDIMELAKTLGYRIGVITNAHLITDKMIERLVDLELSRISISFHGYKKKTYAYHYGVEENYYDKALQTAKKLIDKGCSVGVAYTVTKDNIDEFYDTKKMFIDMGLDSSDVKFNMLLHGNIAVDPLYPSVEQIRQVIKKDPQYFVDMENEKRKSYDLLCAAGRCSFSVNVYGDIYPCSFFNTPAGNILEESIIEVWNNSHLFKICRNFSRGFYSTCEKCSNNNTCNLCVIDNINSTGKFYEPDKVNCEGKMIFRTVLNELEGQIEN